MTKYRNISFLAWSIYGFILGIQYRLLGKRLPHFIAAYIFVFLLVKVFETARYPEFTFHVALGSAVLLGEQYISLEPGADDVYLKDGDAITITQSALVMEQVIGKFLFSKAAGDTAP